MWARAYFFPYSLPALHIVIVVAGYFGALLRSMAMISRVRWPNYYVFSDDVAMIHRYIKMALECNSWVLVGKRSVLRCKVHPGMTTTMFGRFSVKHAVFRGEGARL